MNDLNWLDEEVASEGKIYRVVIPGDVIISDNLRGLSEIIQSKIRETIELHGPFHQVSYHKNTYKHTICLVFEK